MGICILSTSEFNIISVFPNITVISLVYLEDISGKLILRVLNFMLWMILAIHA